MRRYHYSLQLFLSIRIILLLVFPAKALQTNPKVTVQVCTNKDCCKQFQGRSSLTQTLWDLLPPAAVDHVLIEPTGCLSNCGTGPNICIQQENNGDEQIIHGVANAAAAAAEMDLSTSLPTHHPTLLAAVNVMEKAQRATTFEEKLRYLDSVINKLSKSEELVNSAANAHAHCLRAQVHLDDKNFELTKEDVHQAAAIATSSRAPLPESAWRKLADAEEATGEYAKAIEALQKWAQVHPQYATKVAKEVRRLKSLI